MTRYELLDRIGVGGMAEIFRGKAVAAGGFEKPVAIKRILPHLSQDTRFVELLIAEAKVLSLLKHRNIVQIFDVGLGDDGQYFLVMEYVDGKDLGAVQRVLESKRQRLPFDLALHVVAEICEALEHAHTSRGPDGKPMALVHRDVSPSNVLLSRAGEVKLTDFGIAKRADSDATQGGAVRGKFAYISPEQARNESLDPRSDVFSVGILLWELVCNRRLFSGLDDLAALRAVRDPIVPRPTEVDRTLPPEIDAILATALAKDKTRRFSSCGQLGQKLRSLRYSLDVTVGDPATELAKIIDSTEQVERESKTMMAARPTGFEEVGEATVIRIQTADAFSSRTSDIAQARSVIDHFEEEQTRLASLTGEQMRMLRSGGTRESVEMTAEKPRMDRAAAGRNKRPTMPDDDEMTRARDPLDMARLAADAGKDDYEPPLDTPPHQRLTPTDDTRLLAPRDRRTPQPLPGVRPAAKPRAASAPPAPAMPARSRGPTPGPPVREQPSSIPHTRQGTPAPVPVATSTHGGGSQPGLRVPPAQPQPPQVPSPPQLPPQPASPQPPAHALQQTLQQLPPPPRTPAPPGMSPHAPSAAPPPSLHTPLPYGQPQQAPYYAQSPAAGSYPGWGPPVQPQLPGRDATPTAPETFDRPMYPQRASMPEVSGFQRAPRPGLQPWMLVVGAIVMAAVAFAITRAFIG